MPTEITVSPTQVSKNLADYRQIVRALDLKKEQCRQWPLTPETWDLFLEIRTKYQVLINTHHATVHYYVWWWTEPVVEWLFEKEQECTYKPLIQEIRSLLHPYITRVVQRTMAIDNVLEYGLPQLNEISCQDEDDLRELLELIRNTVKLHPVLQQFDAHLRVFVNHCRAMGQIIRYGEILQLRVRAYHSLPWLFTLNPTVQNALELLSPRHLNAIQVATLYHEQYEHQPALAIEMMRVQTYCKDMSLEDTLAELRDALRDAVRT